MNYPDAPRADGVQAGMEFQDFVADQLFRFGIALTAFMSRKYQYERGENLQGIEIKLDDRWHETGRLSIEIAERSDAQSMWVNSGIYRNDNTWLYVQGNQAGFFIFPRKFLRHMFEKNGYPTEEKPKGKPTIRTFYLPVAHAEIYAALVWRPA